MLWFSYRHKGGSHDSTCFRDSRLYQHLTSIASSLIEKRFFFIGDSAYVTESFLLPPYANASPRSPEDGFNFYHSSARITVECAFGEIDLRWGIFWKRLNYSLENSAIIMEGAMRLHNFLVDYRERNNSSIDLEIDNNIFVQDLLSQNSFPVQIGNDLGRPSGRISQNERLNQMQGQCLVNG